MEAQGIILNQFGSTPFLSLLAVQVSSLNIIYDFLSSFSLSLSLSLSPPHSLPPSFFRESLLVLILIVLSSSISSTNSLSIFSTINVSLSQISPYLCIPPSLHTNLVILPSFNTMATVSPQEYQFVCSDLQCLKEKFVALEQEN